MKVLLLAAGGDVTGGDAYPLALEELDGIPLIEHVVRACQKIPGAEIVVAVRQRDARRYSLSGILRILDPRVHIVEVESETAGAACTALLATEHIDNDEELLIVSVNELVNIHFGEVTDYFRAQGFSAGTVVFPSVHPRYSYVKLNSDGRVVQAEEKHTISHTATAGFYWYRTGAGFVAAAKRMILKGADVDGRYYICPTLNEFVLDGQPVGAHAVAADDYHPLKTDRQVERYEAVSTHTGSVRKV